MCFSTADSSAQIVAADDSVIGQQNPVRLADVAGQRDDKFLEERFCRRLRIDGKTRDRSDTTSRVVRLVVAELGDLSQAFLAQKCQIDTGRERGQGGIGANVAGGPRPTDVLLARAQRQHIAAPAVAIRGLAHEPPDKPADLIVPCREYAEMRTAERRRYAERLAIRNDDVGAIGAGRLEQAKRYGIGDNDQQGARFVHGIGKPAHILELTQEVWVLKNEHGRVPIEQWYKRGGVRALAPLPSD